MRLADYDYHLPEELIAQAPAAERAAARMMVVRGGEVPLVHARVAEIGDWLRPGDLLVMNDTRVLPARVYGVKADSGGRVELLFLQPTGTDGEWEALHRASRPSRVGTRLAMADGAFTCVVTGIGERGQVRVRVEGDGEVTALLEAHGMMPLPPYIRRPDRSHDAADRERYQTVVAQHDGAVAAPTAGLHFTADLLSGLAARGVGPVTVTLHVGWGTFRPVTEEDPREHPMHRERYVVSAAAAERIRATRAAGGRVVAVGTTTVRTLETVAREHGQVVAAEGESDIFIYPPYRFQAVDALLTNFHLPRSTLLMLVSALAGADRIRAAYAAAVAARYRFYSYGDCMLILP